MALLLFFLFSLSFQTHLSSASSTLSVNQSLSGTQKLTSEGGKFVLGFFQPGNSSYYYIGIWYSKVSVLTPVWVANRKIAITDPNKSQLKISSDGNLILLDESKSQVWSTNTTIPSDTSTVAVLLDSGNLVVRDDSDQSEMYWQSIDHPTNTWLPGGKLGLNKITGENQRLTAWKNSDDPAPGIYSLEVDPKGTNQFFILWNNSQNYWTSGTWNGHMFSNIPEMAVNFIYEFAYVSNASYNYFTYSIKVEFDSVISRSIIDTSGQLKQLTWIENSKTWTQMWSQPKQPCQPYALCGPFGACNENLYPSCYCIKGFSEKSSSDWDLSDRTGGCERNTQLQCRMTSSAKEEKDGFFPISNVRLPDNSQSLQVSDCESACLNNCACSAYSYNNATGCFVWYGDLLNLQEPYSGKGGGTLYLRLAASELGSSKSKNGVVIGVVIGGGVGLLAFLVIVGLLIWRRRRRGMIGKAKAVEGGLVAYRFSDLQHVTKNFSEKLGGGAFGSVFKGILPDSTAIAVKKLEGLRQGEKQFRTEVSTIGTIQHVNLVRLHGFCSEGNQKLLVYEYMPNSSLDTRLFQSSTKVLDWKTRYQIALGTAQGLDYLHEKCRDCIIHCDIKPENILLDASFIPKVADFGLAKLVGRDFSRVLTTMRGTRGYLAPEWVSGVAITAKADVYSYGMMLFEIISGKRNTDQTEEGKSGFFPTTAVSKLKEGDVINLLDHRLQGDANLEEVSRACKVACWCIQDDENSRPSMGQVVQILEGFLEVSMPPTPRALQILGDNPVNIVFYSELSSNQSSQTRSTTSGSSQTRGSSSMNSQE